MNALANKVVGIAVAIAGVAFIGYCIYFDKKRRHDPNHKENVRERRRRARDGQSFKSEEEMQEYFMKQLRFGNKMIDRGDYVEHLVNAVFIAENPNFLLLNLRGILPDEVFGIKLQGFDYFVDEGMGNTFGVNSGNAIEDVSKNDEDEELETIMDLFGI